MSLSRAERTQVAPAAARPPGAAGLSPIARRWLAADAVVLWLSVIVDAVVTIAALYPPADADPGDFDFHQADGLLGTLGRSFDFLSYFTTWSLVAAACVTTAMALHPERRGPVLRVARLTSILMIAVTFVATTIAYPVWVGAGGEMVGWMIPVHLLKHVAAPVLTLAVWVVLGPRGWIERSTAWWSLVVPLAWIAWTFGRGAVIGAYPYAPINVVAVGYGPALLNVLGVVAAGAVILVALVALDARLGRPRARARRSPLAAAATAADGGRDPARPRDEARTGLR